ncbi:MAG: Siroheme synthase [Bacteroidia bacterium]|nr:Siroheme synthase [Bacteroidia bacterium]
MKNKKPFLSLVGAGPGDPELITLKGIKALKQADVVLYDALTHPDLLNYAPAKSLKISVGKRSGQHSIKQEEINELIVKNALEHGHVVRLKGGDPFVFGRGYEEIEYAESFGIETTVIPGLSSATSLSGLQKIPLTNRGMTESFWVLTGTTSCHQLSEDIKIAVQSTATIVILMGVNKLKEITEIFIQNGKKDLPVAIIQNGSLANEKTVIGTTGTILEIAEKEGISTPAVIVAGEVVSLANNFTSEAQRAQNFDFLNELGVLTSTVEKE